MTPGAAVFAVIVTYQPDVAKVRDLLVVLERSVAHCVVVDNGSQADLERLTSGQVTVERLAVNEGIAAAQNRGVTIARHRGATHILFLDQDSVPAEGMVEGLVSAVAALEGAGIRVACVGPEIHSLPDDTVARFPQVRRACHPLPARAIECLFLISSGTLASMGAMDAIGGFEEGLFIDVVDEEWCLRARSMGYRVFGVPGAVLQHRLGEAPRAFWLGRRRRASRHQPFRYYYIFRNSIEVARRPYVPLRWKLARAALLGKLFLAYGLLAGRGGELRAMALGVRHGIRGVTGRLA
jgi:rhamnosyltransferase